MAVNAQDVQKLREMTGAGMMAAKKALDEAKGNTEKAIELLRKRGEAKVSERSGREAKEGVIASYLHANKKLAAMVMLRCETDFVARTEEFQSLAYDVAMHIAASNPLFVQSTDIPEATIEKEKEIITEQLANEGIPEKVRAKVLDGKLKKYYSEVCLLDQTFIKDPDTTVGELITGVAAKIGEKIQVDTFSRLAI